MVLSSFPRVNVIVFPAGMSHRGQVKDYCKNEQGFPFPASTQSGNTPIISRTGLILLHRNQSDFPHNGHIINMGGLQPLLQPLTLQCLGIYCHGFYNTNTHPSACTTLSTGFSRELGVKFLPEGCRWLFWMTRLKGQAVWGALTLSPGIWALVTAQWIGVGAVPAQHSSSVLTASSTLLQFCPPFTRSSHSSAGTIWKLDSNFTGFDTPNLKSSKWV